MAKSFKSIFSVLFCCCLMLSTIAKAELNSKPIKIVVNNWTSQVVLSHIAGKVFSGMGYQVEYMPLTTERQWGMLGRGLAHVQMEVWQGTMAEKFNKFVQSGNVLDAGSHDASTREEWWYPAYVEEVCPGLPDWQALKKCSALFASSDTAPRGRYVAGPWDKPDELRIRALDLNFKVVKVKESDDLWKELSEAKAKNHPIVLFNWTPNWVEARYDGKFVEFPEYAPECESDTSWGVNPKYPHDCGNPKNGWLKKAASVKLKEQWSCAYQVLEKINFTNAMVAEIAAKVDVDKMSHEAAADSWLGDNEDIWRKWAPENCSD